MVVFNMNNLKIDISDIPESWIYKYYSEKHNRTIRQPFDGRIIKIKSFSNRDSDPSLCIYYNENKGKYFWKDHSSGASGDVINFVSNLISKTYSVTLQTIIKDYERFIDEGGNLDEYDDSDIKVGDNSRFEAVIKAYKVKELDFWRQWKISNTTLSKFNVIPLDYYILHKNEFSIKNKDELMFGFYCRNHELYQIYQPGKKPKYLNTKVNYLIGRDQLRFQNDTCIIVSGLKDLMALYMLGLKIEIVAPRSENTLIKSDDIEFLKSRYKYVITMFDNDEPGIKAMKRYQNVYNIPYIHINLEQDLAKNSKRYNFDFLINHYTIYINKKINE